MTSSLQCALLVGDTRQLEFVDIPRLPILATAELCRLLPETPELSGLRQQLATVLDRQLTPTWIESADLTSLFAVLNGLHTYDPTMVSGRDLGLIAKRLLSTEVAVGGPYADKPAGLPDPVANAYIHTCLEWMAAPLPNVVSFIEEAFGSLSADVEPADFGLHALLTEQDIDSLYAADLLCAAILASVAHCLWLHLDWLVADQDLADQGCAKEIAAACQREIRGLPVRLRTELGNMLDRIAQSDCANEISQIAQYFAEVQKDQNGVDHDLLVQLGMANTFAWAAYTIYDDFLDNEGAPHMLGAANYALRTTVRIYKEVLPGCPGFHAAVDQAFATVDDANVREVLEHRLTVSGGALHITTVPDFESCELLAERAILHALGPMAILANRGVSPGTDAWNNTLKAFKQYLIARQINDDIQDWAEDLQTGNATFVVVRVLRRLGLGAGVYRLEQLMPVARQAFWRHVLPEVCSMAIMHLMAARKELLKDSSTLRKPSNGLSRLLDRVEGSLRQAARQKEQSEELLDVFSSQH